MSKKLILFLILLTNAIGVYSQVKILGTVMGKLDNLEIPGVSVVEKGTQNGTVTNIDGKFELNLTNPNAVLVFSFVGMVSKEYKLKGQSEITVIMKADCMMDSFDHQLISILVSSGLINNPVGGQFDFSFPAFLKSTTLKTGVNYQANFGKNEFLNTQIELDHVIFECDFQMDLKWFYRKVSFDNNFNSTAYSIETNLIFYGLYDWNIYSVGLIAGYSELAFEKIGTNNSQISSGLIVGLRAYIGKPFFATVSGKVSVYKDMLEYQGQIRSDYKIIAAFVKFYKLDSFSELSIGVGLNLGYRSKKQRM